MAAVTAGTLTGGGKASALPPNNHLDCRPAIGGLSFQVTGALNRQYITGADVDRCTDGWWNIHIYPGWRGRLGGVPDGQKAANVAVQELQSRLKLSSSEIKSIQNQVYCHAVVPYIPGVSSNIWKLKGAQVWDIETYRSGGVSVADQALTGCNWAW